jgi:hypothetical protein
MVFMLGACGWPTIPPSYVLSGVSTIAIQLQPPRPQPGESATLTVFIADPNDGGPIAASLSRCVAGSDCLSADSRTLLATINATSFAPHLLTATFIQTMAATGSSDRFVVSISQGQSHFDAVREVPLSQSSPQIDVNPGPVSGPYFIAGEQLVSPPLREGLSYVINAVVTNESRPATFFWYCSPTCSIDNPTPPLDVADAATLRLPSTFAGKALTLYLVVRDDQGGQNATSETVAVEPESQTP